MRVLLLQLDGKLPSVALLRVAAHHRDRGDDVSFAFTPGLAALDRELDFFAQRVYGSLIFTKTRPLAEELLRRRPDSILGGTGWDLTTKLDDHGVTTRACDYSIYPAFKASIGFTQRGCRLKCSFCVVPQKEGSVTEEQTVADLWRGDPWPRHLLLLDNDFFGQPRWRERISEIRDGDFRVSFTQGINARLLDDEAAEALASVQCYDDSFTRRRLYTAWDNRKDEERLFRGLNALVHYGMKPDLIMVYMLVGYWERGKLTDSDFYRHKKLRDFGCRPYPMPFVRTRELVGFQRWVIGAYDKRVSWQRWEGAGYRPERLLDEVVT